MSKSETLKIEHDRRAQASLFARACSSFPGTAQWRRSFEGHSADIDIWNMQAIETVSALLKILEIGDADKLIHRSPFWFMYMKVLRLQNPSVKDKLKPAVLCSMEGNRKLHYIHRHDETLKKSMTSSISNESMPGTVGYPGWKMLR